ncbi:hypothetical protein H2LOC_009065 [Methylocystis heyeri]|uniref:DUF2460 domain-containing protein n=1 Tax=Methylocystis heyeri TaxID=391905 RepID=A0A6B8KKA6_9HYPH|nr:hypothetical protein H2LOC_009065 [Methylocystis heyeri]
MTLPIFPTLAGQGFAARNPIAESLIAPHDCGREVRAALFGGLYEFEVSLDGLASDSGTNPGLGATSLQEIMGLYLQCAGGLGNFLYADPNDNAAVDQLIAIGDGSTMRFPFMRRIGVALEPVGFVTGVAEVSLNAVPQPSGWALDAPNLLQFATPPPVGASIATSFTFAFVCRFVDDELDFENFMQNLWAAKSVKFRSVRQ